MVEVYYAAMQATAWWILVPLLESLSSTKLDSYQHATTLLYLTLKPTVLHLLSLLFCSSTGQFFRKHIRRGEPGGRRWTWPQVQGQRQGIHAGQRRRPSPFRLPQSHPRVQGRGQNHLNSSPTTAAALFYPLLLFLLLPYSIHPTTPT